MYRHRPFLTVTLLSTTILALLLAVGCDFSEEGRAKEAPITTSNTRTIGAGGSTFIAPLMTRWASSYEQAHPVHLNYRPIRLVSGHGFTAC